MMRKPDIILLAALCLIGIALTVLIYLPSGNPGAYVEVRENGIITKRLPLIENKTVTIENGSRKNILHIENGTAYISDANCKDKSCVTQGKISRAGETIICLPHKLSIEITGEDSAIDGISH